MTHPGIPPIPSGTTKVSDWRQLINDSARSVPFGATLVGATVLDVEAHGTYVRADATSGAFTVSLPDFTADASHVGVRFHLIKIDATGNAVTIDTVGAPTINGAASISLPSQWSKVTVWNDGVAWYIEA